jgi:hypothetical protein
VFVQLKGGANPIFFTSSATGWLASPSYYTEANAWAAAIDWNTVPSGWSTPAFTPGQSWTPVQALEGRLLPARALQMPLSTVLREVKPISVTTEGLNGSALYKFPLNFVGTVSLKVGLPMPFQRWICARLSSHKQLCQLAFIRSPSLLSSTKCSLA